MIRNCKECPKKPGPSTIQPPSSSSGRIRLFSPEGDRSALATISLETTAADLAKAYDVDSIYLVVGNLRIRALSPSARPLAILREFLASLGHSESAARSKGTELRFRHLIAFFLGRPVLQPNSIARSEILIAHCDVRRGKLVHRWSRHKCLLYNGCLRIQKDTGEDDVISLSRCSVDVSETRRGRCLRLQTSASAVLLHFDEPETLALWSTRCRQNGQRNVCDLSDRRLTLLPESLLCSDTFEVHQLNLRRNSLSSRGTNDPSPVQIGWLDDLSRLVSLTTLDLSSNHLTVFPTSTVQLPNLQKLNLSSNCIQSIPTGIRLLRRLSTLDLENNWISSLPAQLIECHQLVWLNLRFNRIKQVQEEILCRLPLLREWTLAGNYIECLNVDGPVHIDKLDLRRSSLCGCFRLQSGCFDQLTFLDIRDNCNVSTVHLTNIPSLQVLHCERLQLTSLHLNGQSLTHLHAHHNMLDCLIIMPVPLHLVFIDISYNNFDVLPEWIGELPQIDCLRVNNNRLTSLPSRLFSVSSMRYLFCKNNKIRALPDSHESSNLLSCVLYNNLLTELPSDFLLKSNRLRHLNVSFNRLSALPAVSSKTDRNRIHTLRLSSNRLDESIVPVLMKMKRLKVLDLSHNRLRYFDDSALCSLNVLEELNLSSNELASLSPSIFELPALQVLKVHSNRIRTIPDLSVSSTLQTVDMSNNVLGVFASGISIGPSLNQLDLTCNSALNLTSGTLRRSHKKPVALFDIGSEPQDRVQMGFSETSGSRNKLCIRRIHYGDIFGMVDGSSNYEMPKMVQSILKRTVLSCEHQNNLSAILLKAHECLEEAGERLGATSHLTMSYVGNIGAAVMSAGHLMKLTDSNELDEEQYDRIRSAGGTVDEKNVINGVTSNCRQLGFYSLHPVVTPKPISKAIPLNREIDYVVIASWAVWEFLSGGQIASILASSINPQVAAKMIQDALQACDYNGNACVVVIRLLKPELTFRSSATPQPAAFTPMAVPPMRAEKTRDQETTLQKIEQRLEKISEVIAKMEDDTTTGQGADPHSVGRRLYDRITAEEKVSNWMLSPSSSSIAPPPPDPDASTRHTQLVDELKWRVAAKDELKPSSSFFSSARAGNVATSTEERQQAVNARLSEVLDLPQPHVAVPLPDETGVHGISTDENTSFGGNTQRDTAVQELNAPLAFSSKHTALSTRAESPCAGSHRGVYSTALSQESLVVDQLMLKTLRGSDSFKKGTSASNSRPRVAEVADFSVPKHANKASEDKPPPYSQDFYGKLRATPISPPSDSTLVKGGFPTPPHSDPICSYDLPSSSSGVYSIQQATRERLVPLCRSFDYYSHTKVRPIDDMEELDVPSRTTTPFLEYANLHRRKMSVIEEGPEALQRSSSEERAPSSSPPPLPDSDAPRETHTSAEHRRTVSELFS